MAVKYVSDFTFPTEFGFSGSAKGRHDARNHPTDMDDQEYGDGSYVETHAAVAKDKFAKGGHAKGKRHFDMGGPVVNSVPFNGPQQQMGPPLAQNRPMTAPAMPQQGAQAPMPAMARGGRMRKADGGDVWSADDPKPTKGYSRRAEPMDGGDQYGDYKRGGRIKRAMGGPVTPPGQAPAGPGAVPMGATADGAPGAAPDDGSMQRASITMPLADAARAASGAEQAGQMVGARKAVGAIASAVAQRRQAAMHARMNGAPAAAGALNARQPAPAGGPMPAMAKGGHLTAKERHAMPAKDFALPGGRYPIPDKAHAANAKARVSQFGTPSEKARVDAAVARKFPGMGKK
jgi:hypothetical protein